jgi:hypothetical protein
MKLLKKGQRYRKKGGGRMSTLKRILGLAVVSLFLMSIFVGCAGEPKTEWDSEKKMYVPVEEPAE